MDLYEKILGMSKCFNGFGREELKQLLAISTKNFWQTDQDIFLEGDSGRDMFIILSGKIIIWRQTADAKLPLATLSAGESFGEMALINGGNRGASAKAMEDTLALHISQERLLEIPGAAAILYRNIARALADRLNDANNIIVFQTLLDE
jgi:CRP-like cAMP-binding protein